MGLAFKPGTDDMREASSVVLAARLLAEGAHVRAYDPVALEAASSRLSAVALHDDPWACVTGADAVVIVTEWDAFRALDLDRVKRIAKAPVLVDLRNIYDPAEVRAKGFAYSSVGRP